MTRPSRLLSCLFLVSLLAIASPAAAWGRRAHAAIANIAESNLTPAARAQVRTLLQDDQDKYGQPSGRSTLADVASWADEIRDVAPKRRYRGWHSRENPVCSHKLGPCPDGACVDQKLMHYISVLKNQNATHRERNEALKFVVHLVGDLHVPLHSGSNHDKTGHFPATIQGTKVRPNSSLHSLWDHDFVVYAFSKSIPAATLDKASQLPRDAIGQWMRETRDVSRKHVYDTLPGFRCGIPYTGPVELPRSYMKQARPVIRLQITRAGLRLAQVLNEALAP